MSKEVQRGHDISRMYGGKRDLIIICIRNILEQLEHNSL